MAEEPQKPEAKPIKQKPELNPPDKQQPEVRREDVVKDAIEPEDAVEDDRFQGTDN